MKNLFKTTFSVAALAVFAGINLAPAVLAWGDSDGGRRSYTLSEVENNALGDKIVFNSISNSVMGDEKNFVGAREDTGINAGPNNQWQGNTIDVVDGKTYLIRLYVHNNNPKGDKAIAKDVHTSFKISSKIGRSAEINGMITSSNAAPKKYWDNVVLKSDKYFKLEYVKGSARLENNGVGAVAGGLVLSDQIINENGVKIGYNSLNGEIPGCFQYASYITIKVKPVFIKNDTGIIVEKKVRMDGTKDWKESIIAKVGDKVNYQIHYRNISEKPTTDVMIRDILPENMELIKGTTVLLNATNPKGTPRDDTINTTGVNIGGYAVDGDGYVRFTAKVIDKSLVCGQNKLVNWGKVTAAGKASSDSADVFVNKLCPESNNRIPETGPTNFITGLIGITSVTIATGYYLTSRKQLR